MLVEKGLKQDEADAMMETWSGTWFEEGTRIFFILPRSNTDAILPLTIQPQPQELIRVIVGRIEILTPEMEDVILKLARLEWEPGPEGDKIANIVRMHFGRFREPLLKLTYKRADNDTVRKRINYLILRQFVSPQTLLESSSPRSNTNH